MVDALSKLVSDHGLAALLAIVSIGLTLWLGKWIFLNFAGLNAAITRIERDLGRLLERRGIHSIPPPDEPAPPARRKILRHATPLPFHPVPQPDDKEP
jgi:hypothetical protein